MSMMVNPSGHNQIIAAGQPFKLRMPRKKLSTEPEEATEQPADEPDAGEADGGRADGGTDIGEDG